MSETKKMNCIGLTENYEGFCKLPDGICYVKGLLPKEEAFVEITYHKNSVYRGEIKSITKKSKDRIEPLCKTFFHCGGCQGLNFEYKAQIEEKRMYLERLYKNETFQYNKEIHMTEMKNPYYYRYKVIASFKESKSHKVTLGLYEENTHKVVPYEECIIQNKEANQILKSVIKACNQCKLEVYDARKNTGFLRHVLIRTSYTTKKSLLVIVTKDEFFPGRRNFVEAITKLEPSIQTIIQNFNSRDTSIVLGDRQKVLYGTGYVLDEINGISFRISGQSFYQVNPYMMEKLYQAIYLHSGITSNDVILDAYSGIGTIGLYLSKYVDSVISVERNKEAVMDAIANTKSNNIKNVKVIGEDATQFLLNTEAHFDCIVLDPPREGSTLEFLNGILRIKPKKVIYVSCDPKTQCRDLKALLKEYRIKYIEGFDMFPHTANMECLVCLEHK